MLLRKKQKCRPLPARLAALLLAAALTVPACASARAEETTLDVSGIRLVVNGTELTGLPMSPVVYDNHTLVPAREVFESLGAVVDWKPDTQEIYVGYDKRLLVMVIDQNTANLDGVTTPMAVPPKIINGKTMIPLRFVSECFGFEVEWYANTRLVSVSVAPQAGAGEAPSLDLAVLQALANDGSAASSPAPSPAAQPATAPAASTQPAAPPVARNTADTPAIDVSDGPIPTISAPPTQITAVGAPESGAGSFTVQASSAIGRVEKSLLPDNRLVLDFYDADMALPQAEYNVTHSAVRQIRAAQFQTEPEKIARVVFDLMGGTSFKVSISDDRKTVTVELAKNTVTSAAFSTDGTYDYLTLQFSGGPAATAYPLTNPDRLVVDAANAEMAKLVDQAQNGKFVSNMRAEQADAATARVTLDLKATVSFTVTTAANSMTIRLSEPTYKNLRYDTASKTLEIRKNPAIAMQLGNWTAQDRYNELTYTMTLPGDFAALLGYGDYIINDAYIRQVTIRNNGTGQTELVFNENRVLAFNVSEDASNIYVKAVLPKEKYPRIVVLDAGHGGTDYGTMQNGLNEKDINFDVANRVAALLEQEGSVKVYRTRTTDYKVPLEDRPVFANSLADLFVAIHCDSAGANRTANGTTTYYYPHENDAAIGISTKRTAEIMQAAVTGAVGSTDRGATQSGYWVIKYTEIPSVLVEMGFLSNPDEAARLGSDEFKQKYAEALAQGIFTIFNQYAPKR